MRPTRLTVSPYKASSTSRWVVDGLKKNGRRQRKFFPTRIAAESFKRNAETRLIREGQAAMHVPEKLRIEAVGCAARLKAVGKTLTDATDHYLAHIATVAGSCALSALVPQFLAAMKALDARERYRKTGFDGCFRDRFGFR
jgi:hypothetical protein